MKGANRQRGEIRREEQGFGGRIEKAERRDGGKLSSGRKDKEGVGRWYTDEEIDWRTKALRREMIEGKKAKGSRRVLSLNLKNNDNYYSLDLNFCSSGYHFCCNHCTCQVV